MKKKDFYKVLECTRHLRKLMKEQDKLAYRSTNAELITLENWSTCN